MAIEKNNFKVSRFDSEFSPGSRKSMSSDDDELQRRSSAVESDDDDEFDDADSGAGSDDFDLLELGETGVEFCQVGNQTCSIPFELYDLQGLEDILSVDVWNECLAEEDRFGLTKFLPDMDQETYMLTLKDLFTGCNFHFGSPVKKLFDMLKGGQCEPRVALYREGLNFFQKRQHYHLVRKHQNNMVSNFCQTRDAWLNCRGYSIEERLRVLNIMKSQKSLMHEKMEDLEAASSERESDEVLRNIRIKGKISQKIGHHSAYGVGPNLDIPLRGRALALESTNYGKQHPKGMLKLGRSKNPTAKEPGGRITSVYHGLDMNSAPYSSAVALPRQSKASGYESGAALRMRDQMRINDDGEVAYGIGDHRNRISMMDKSVVLKVGRKHDLPRGDELASESLFGFPPLSKTDLHSYGRKKNANALSEAKLFTTKPSNVRAPYDAPKKAKYTENVQQFAAGDQMKLLKGRLPQQALKGNRVDSSDRIESFWNIRDQEEAFSVDSPPFRSDDWSVRSKKRKTGRESPEFKYKSYRSSPPQFNDRFSPSEYRAKPFEEKIRGQNGGPDTAAMRGNKLFNRNEETESDSSDKSYDDEDSNPLLRSKMAYPTGVGEASRSSLLKSGQGAKKAKVVKKDTKATIQSLDGATYSSKKVGNLIERGHIRSAEKYSSKAKQKGKLRDSSPLHESSARVLEDSYDFGLGKFAAADDHIYNLVKNGQLSGEPVEKSQKAYSVDGKQKRGVTRNHSVSHSNRFRDYNVDEEDGLHQAQLSADGKRQGRFGKKGQITEAYVTDHCEKSEASLLGCSMMTKKRKGKVDVTDTYKGDKDNDLISNNPQNIQDSNSSKKKAKKKVEADAGSSDIEPSEPPISEVGTTDMELETKPQKKTFTLITPTVHTGFSFSIIHLLSAVRLAMITPLPEDTLEGSKSVDEQNKKEDGIVNGVPYEKEDASNVEHAGEVNVPSLTVQEIVNRVRSNPGDPCILETQEPLQDLVRGVLKIFSSKTAPLGAKGWKTLAVYEKSTKSWSWLGPISHSSSDHETIEEVTSPEAWSLPHKMLVKLVDSFANWLKSGQETLQQIGSLPEPPLALMQLNLDEKERFRDLRAQKSLNTITPSTEEVRAYFRKEEVLRYSIPDRAFSYTAADGKKSIVAPLRRCGGKPTSKARDHFMLKRDRPPHVTILCLVRDAAARLPGSIGTRADVCTLIRDSQYIVEDVSDAQVNQVVSGALDRLHYERDPCVQFDGERKLWVYLHREREEEDFEDDGTSSTKKWKRQKKEAAEQADQGTVTVAYPGAVDQTGGYDLCSDLNAEPSSVDDKGELGFDDVRQSVDDNVEPNQGSEQGDIRQGHPIVWDALDLNPMEKNKLLCQENSTNEDFDDETFSRERPVGLLSASL
ncbi:Nuclear factor related to kappa-B-binding protein [Parasponia andersonii]|uniref:Nuclear factor related to kappa-B-binding protein n=1 Tax=Parasponia andersonii TaxID=3476 RepID=A0A2P5A838_PARAD|nr:Nuclear factor related to kappa-B-binding protein [Parasponia andersonii]